MTKTIIDELIEFAEELTLLIKQDWEKSKQFIKKHKTYFFWILALFVSMQFTDILSLGKSWDTYCKKHNIQNGGDNSAVASVNISTKQGDDGAKQGDEGAKQRDEGAKQGDDGAKQGDDGAKQGDEGAKQGDDGDKQGTGAGAGGPTSAGQPQRMRSRGQMGQSRIGRSQSRFGRNMRRNPVFGNLDKIFNMTQGMFALVMFILVIVGVLSLPVIIFIIITYCIIKNLCSRLAIL